ncbi:MAG TPA: 2-dehydro-3-deoxygalactonokinase, partial [Lysobacter sp.]|nr:2-dehydro-3-deoxygalactonokinase [Lysobacter sp.]
MIAVDWGTSSLRAYRLDDDGAILDQRRSDRGVLSCDGHFAAELARQIDGWDDACIMLCGMIGSRGGWMEVPYVECPGGEREIAASIVELASESATFAGRDLRIIPGMIDRNS